MARSSSVAASNIQSCSISAPSPNGFSRLSLGPVTYPSSEMDMSLITFHASEHRIVARGCRARRCPRSTGTSACAVAQWPRARAEMAARRRFFAGIEPAP
jgi:hypothetical protein